MTKIQKGVEMPTKPRTIERGIPLHDWRQLGANSQLIGRMEVGDSILFDDMTVQNIRSLASRHHGKKFSIRTVEGGFRIWRTE